jgi:hypothetical protein
VLASAPAYAAVNVICVRTPVGPCNQTVATIPIAITAAATDGQDSTILVGPGTYNDGPYQINGATTMLQGSGEDTVLTLPDSPAGQGYLNLNGAHVRDLTIQMTGGANSVNDSGLIVYNGGSAENVTVDGLTTVDGAQGAALTDADLVGSSVLMARNAVTRGVYGQGGNTITDSTIEGTQAYYLSTIGGTEILSRVTINAGATGGIWMDSGTLNIDDSVIDLGTSGGAGIQAYNSNNTPLPKVVDADHLTIVGGGLGSKGIWAFAAAPGAQQSAVVDLTNSIVRGPDTDLVTDASNNGLQGGNSVAQINVSYSDYHSTGGTIGANGAGGVVPGTGNLDVDPLFANAASSDYHLKAISPVVDQGDPAAGGPATDRDGTARVFDGDVNGIAVRDMGAYEMHDLVAPDTTIDSGPSGLTNDATPTFAFSSEAGATFECKVDAGSFATCTSPFTAASLVDGSHTFSVRATDAAANTDASPATRNFTVDTVAPDTTVSGPSGAIADATPTFTFSSETGATFECNVDGAAYAACSNPYTTATLADGAHTFSVRARDAATNADATPATRSFTVDTTTQTTITKKPAKRTTKRKVKFGFTASEAGVTFECKLDKRAYRPCTSPKKYRVKLGKHTFLVRATDAAGNVDATPAKYTFRRIAKTT